MRLKIKDKNALKNFFVSIPHSGECIPEESPWLKGLSENILMCDVDRFVDKLYVPGLHQLGLFSLSTKWHRYAVDLNRLPSDIDEHSVEMKKEKKSEQKNKSSLSFSSPKHPTGLHWSITTKAHPLMKKPMSFETHQILLQKYYTPFHNELQTRLNRLKKEEGEVFLLDAHSMPSQGTEAHRDPGGARPQVVVSDREGKSSKASFTKMVVEAYERAGFEVKKNWPYKGGRITEAYGRPEKHQHVLQVELNRFLYMDESTRKIKDEHTIKKIQGQLLAALTSIVKKLKEERQKSA